MLSIVATQILAALLYIGLVIALAWARPPSPRLVSGDRHSAIARSPSGASYESLWLACLIIAFAYPLAVLAAPALVLSSSVTADFPGSTEVQLAGGALLAIGIVLLGWAFRALGRYATVQLQLTGDQKIVRSGPYSRVRHPIYTAVIVLATGIALSFLSYALLPVVVGIVLIARARARTEEELFLSSPTLGPEYAAYISSTGRFLPRTARRSDR